MSFTRLRALAALGGVSLAGFLSSPHRIMASGCPGSGQQSSGPDVIVGVLSHDSVTNFGSQGGLEAFSLGTTSCNLGNVWLNWLQAPNTNHPVIGQNFFRMKQVDGSRRFEQLGQSWLKHGFFALSDNACCSSCSGTDGTHLGVGCSDPYSSSRNAGQGGLGPKWQVNATTGVHIHPIASPSWSGLGRLLKIRVTDLEPSDGTGDVNATRYFAEAQYVAADDAAAGNKNNNASYRPMVVTGGGSAWSFSALGTTQREQAAIRAWKDTDPDVSEVDITTQEASGMTALVILAAQATDLGGGMWHYEVAIQNLNSDRSIGSVLIPIRPDAVVTNIGFRDVDYHDGDGPGNVNYSGTDWPAVRSNLGLTWSTEDYGVNQSANAIRWGTLYNFRFDADVAPWPGKGTITLGYFKPGAVPNVTAKTVTPDPCIRGDMNTDALVDSSDIPIFIDRLIGGGASFHELCAGDLEAVRDSIINMDDLSNFADCLLAAGCG